MDQKLPSGMHSEPPSRRGRRRLPVVVLSDGRRLPIVSRDGTGFVIAADAPRLRGFVDIVESGDLLDRRLVVCAWEQDGLIGYEYKSVSSGRPSAVDYAPPAARPDPSD